jgi:Ca2+-transporting ATPase
MDELLKRKWHRLGIDEVVDLLDTDPRRGLDVMEVGRRQKRFGPNAIETSSGPGPLKRFLLQFHQPLIYILLVSSLITFVLQEYVDSAVILAVVLINAIVGFIQEHKAVQALAALARSMATRTTTVRAGQERDVDARELVPGDVVLLEAGDKVPADLRLIEARRLQVDESVLTGESSPVAKQTEALADKTHLADRADMAYASTLVTQGTGRGVVVGIGAATEVGRISGMMEEAEELKTPLTRKIERVSGWLMYVILGLGVLTFVASMLHGQDTVTGFMSAVALAVGAIPEGLPAAVTVILAMGVNRMAKRRAIIRKLPAVETLGSTTVICTDKTGTLTENQMTVTRMLAGGRSFEVGGSGYAAEGEFKGPQGIDPGSFEPLVELLRAGTLCNDSRIVDGENGPEAEGDPTEASLLVAAAKLGLDRSEARDQSPRLDAVPFESKNQYMATLHRAGDDRREVLVKGAPGVILPWCDRSLTENGPDDLDRDSVDRRIDELTAEGLRVLALARADAPAGLDELTGDNLPEKFTFLGLAAMMDPPRAEAAEAVAACRRAGITVKMITGDHAATAAAIARKVGVIMDGDPDVEAMDGDRIDELDDQGLIEAVGRVNVFARVTPEQKLRLVEALQARGQIAAMTGDGVNDAPALKQADIGVAMGRSGTEVSREAADMVLTDDNFATIERAVEEGRGVFDNLVKFMVWALPTNIGEGLVILIAVFLGATLPMLPVQILWINMTTAGFLGLMLAFEPREPGIMDRSPRDPARPILAAALIFRILMVSLILTGASYGLFLLEQSRGASLETARTVAVNVFVFIEAFYLFNCRSLIRSARVTGVRSNWFVLGGACFAIGVQLLYTYLPVMNRLFQSAPLAAGTWLWVVGAAAAAFSAVELEKYVRRQTAR